MTTCPFCGNKKKNVLIKIEKNEELYPDAEFHIYQCSQCKRQFAVFKQDKTRIKLKMINLPIPVICPKTKQIIYTITYQILKKFYVNYIFALRKWGYFIPVFLTKEHLFYTKSVDIKFSDDECIFFALYVDGFKILRATNYNINYGRE